LADVAAPRSWTNLLTNEAYLHVLDTLVDPNDVLEGRVPIAALPALLHESSHHACLSGSVGFTLAVLDRRARRQLGSEDPAAAISSILKITTTLEAYRPVLEGVALFTEFDALHGDSKVMSQPLWWAVGLCVEGKLRDRGDSDAWRGLLFGELTDSRLTGESITRRLRVLSTSLRDPGAYALGYLYVKTWRRWAARSHPAFRDSDFAALFVGEYFFNDYELVSRLLDPDVTPEQIEGYALRRLASIFEPADWQRAAERFEHILLGYNVDPAMTAGFEPGPVTVPGSPAGAERGRVLLAEAVGALPVDDQPALARRRLMHLVSLSVRVEIEGELAYGLLDGRRVLAVEVQDRDARGGQGTLDLFIETASRTRCVSLSAGGRIVHLSCHGPYSEFVRRWARQLNLGRTDDTTSSLDSLLAVHDSLPAVYRRLVSGIGVRRLNLIAPRALASVGQGQAIRSLVLEPAGFRSVLGRRSTKALAVLSAAEGVGSYLEETRVTDEPFDIVMETAALNARLQAAGLPAVALVDVDDEQGQACHEIRSWV